MSKKYFNIHSMTVKHCQEMLMTRDYLMICKGKVPIIKYKVRKEFDKFSEDLRGLFGGDEDIANLIDIDILLIGMRLSQDVLRPLYTGFKTCYEIRPYVEGQLASYELMKAHYRELFHEYPISVVYKTIEEEESMSDSEVKAYNDLRQSQIDSVLKTIKDRITFLDYKIQEHTPDQKNKHEEDENSKGLFLHIQFVQQVDGINFDHNRSVHDLSLAYNEAVRKNNKNRQE